MKNAYPIVMTQGKEFIVVFVPDFNINTQGKDVPDAIEMARDAIGLMGIDMQDDGEALPEASSIASAPAVAPGTGAGPKIAGFAFSPPRCPAGTAFRLDPP